MSDQALLVLPMTISGQAQLARLVRELEQIENDFEHQKAQSKASAAPKLPTMSRALADCVELNKIDIMDSKARTSLKSALKFTKEKAPVMHFTFSVEADPQSMQQLVAYVRKEIHPQALISVGLQPGLIGGTYLRTPNHVHDFSLKARLHDKRGLIAHDLEALHE